jgi:hypothetical protein
MQVSRDVFRNLVLVRPIGQMRAPGPEGRASDVPPARSSVSQKLMSWQDPYIPAVLLVAVSALSALAGSAITFRRVKKRWPWQRPQVNPFIQYVQHD